MEAFCILAAGKGSRLQNYSKLHKCLLPLDNQAVITHIINKAPTNAKIIIAVGYQKEIVTEYCKAAHPDKNITFIDVDNFDGPGSGPGHSLSCCKPHLQQPFYLFCADCLIVEKLPALKTNWIGVFPVKDPQNWSTVQEESGTIISFKNKSLNGYNLAFIGVAGIKDYDIFWQEMKPSEDKEFEMVSAFYRPEMYGELKAIRFTWHDTGTPENYQKSKKKLTKQSNLGMDKEIDEITYKTGNICVKVFGDKSIAAGRIKRAELLAGLTPKLTFAGNNVYAYTWQLGKTLYDTESTDVIARFLIWCKKNLWKPVEDKDFKTVCKDFYNRKTYSRLQSYYAKKNIKADSESLINGRACLPIEYYLNQIDWEYLYEGLPHSFHGDLQFENIIFGNDNNFYLIDWRDSFGTLVSHGDIYYDLGKLYAGMNIDFRHIKQGDFYIWADGVQADNIGITTSPLCIDYKFPISKTLEQTKLYFENWIMRNNYNLLKVRVICALIYLNMAPLHTQPFSDLLFNHSKYLLSMIYDSIC